MLEGMSDLCMYEFEDTTWGEFGRSDDHIVPHPSLGHANVDSTLGSSQKLPRCEITKSTHNTGDRSRCDKQRRDEVGFPIMNKKRSTMVGKTTLPQTPAGVYPSPSDSESMKEVSSSASDNDRSLCSGFKNNNADSNGSESCDTALNKTSAVDNSSFNYPLGDVSQTGSTLDFLGNTGEKDSNEFLYYGWPEIGNFEDVDKMFRSCDSTFGFGASREDDLNWFSSADDTPGSGDVLDSNCRFPSSLSKMSQNIEENQESSKSYSINDFTMASGPIRFKDNSWASEESDPYVSFVNGPDIAGNGGVVLHKEQAGDPKKQPILGNQPVGKAEENYFRDGSCNHDGYLSSDVVQQSSVTTAYQASPSVCMQQAQVASSSDYGYQRNAISYAQTDSRLLFNPPSVKSIPSAVKSEAKGLSSLSPRASSLGSSLTSVASGGKRETILNCHVSQTPKDSVIKNVSMAMQQSICDSGSEGKRAHTFQNKFENHNDIEGINMVVPAELGSSNAQESSTMSSGLHDSSLEAASFRQLRLVTEQLDLRTKLCIRDSLYRLARSAEQRHHHETLNGALMGEGAKNFMDMETDTNPIDRSIAHLLFHRPSESSAYPIEDSLLLDSPAVQVHGSLTGAQETAPKMERAIEG